MEFYADLTNLDLRCNEIPCLVGGGAFERFRLIKGLNGA
jgi:hypothetical protein